jgi:hypothetical protein
MAEPAELTFALERFEWAAADRLEIVGRWEGLTGRRLGRPLLHVHVGGRRRRLTAIPGGQPPASGERWEAAFAWPHGAAEIERAELEIGRSLLVDLPAPRRPRRSRSGGDGDRALRALRAELAELRKRHERLEAEHAALGDQHAALIARSGELRGALNEALDGQERLSGELAKLREAHQSGEETDRRVAEERAATTAVREKLAAAREEARQAIAAEAEETERLRLELAGAREEAERVLAAERAEIARLREELAARPAPDRVGEDADEAGRRMYERISRELERERATVRELRSQLDATRTETAEHRRSAAVAATNGMAVPHEAPVPATPGAAARRHAAALLAARAELDPRAPYRRDDAARAAAAQRVPEHHRSTARVWATRAAALVLVAALLLALALIVTAVT